MDESEFSQWIIIGQAGGENGGVSSPCFAFLFWCVQAAVITHGGEVWSWAIRSALISVISSEGLTLQWCSEEQAGKYSFSKHICLNGFLSPSVPSCMPQLMNACMHQTLAQQLYCQGRETAFYNHATKHPPPPICFSDLTVARAMGIPNSWMDLIGLEIERSL